MKHDNSALCRAAIGTTICVRPGDHDGQHVGWRHGEEFRWTQTFPKEAA